LSKSSKPCFRVLHFSVQGDHVHLIGEATDRAALSHGMRGLAIRVAKAINKDLGRHGKVWEERYHSRDLKTPREVRNAIAYVLLNWRKHIRNAPCGGVDRCSSGIWFNGWKDFAIGGGGGGSTAPATVAGHTWLANVGWRRHGLVSVDERPGA